MGYWNNRDFREGSVHRAENIFRWELEYLSPGRWEHLEILQNHMQGGRKFPVVFDCPGDSWESGPPWKMSGSEELEFF